jgi:hypothetical protein
LEKVHQSNYKGCRHAKEELLRKMSQRIPKSTTGRLFPAKMTTPGVSFEAALSGRREDQQQPLALQVQWNREFLRP